MSNTARCVGCNTVVRLPSLKSRAISAKCEPCIARERDSVREARGAEQKAARPATVRRQWFEDVKRGFSGDAPVFVNPAVAELVNPPDESLYFKTVYDSGPAPERGGPYVTVTKVDAEKGVLTFSSAPGVQAFDANGSLVPGVPATPRWQRVLACKAHGSTWELDVEGEGSVVISNDRLRDMAMSRGVFYENIDGLDVMLNNHGDVTDVRRTDIRPAAADKWEQIARELTEEKRRVAAAPVYAQDDVDARRSITPIEREMELAQRLMLDDLNRQLYAPPADKWERLARELTRWKAARVANDEDDDDEGDDEDEGDSEPVRFSHQARTESTGRRSGRTTRQLGEAIALAKQGHQVVFYVHSGRMVVEAWRIVRDAHGIESRGTELLFPVRERPVFDFSSVAEAPRPAKLRTGSLRIETWRPNAGRGRGIHTPIYDHAINELRGLERTKREAAQDNGFAKRVRREYWDSEK